MTTQLSLFDDMPDKKISKRISKAEKARRAEALIVPMFSTREIAVFGVSTKPRRIAFTKSPLFDLVEEDPDPEARNMAQALKMQEVLPCETR